MSNRIATSCGTPGCPAIAKRRGLCIDCQRTRERQRGNATERGYGAAWQRLRKMILSRDPVCRDESGCSEPSTDVDHVISRAHGGSNNPSNLQGLCHSHHSSKTAREDSRWGVGGKQKSNGSRIQGPLGSMIFLRARWGIFVNHTKFRTRF